MATLVSLLFITFTWSGEVGGFLSSGEMEGRRGFCTTVFKLITMPGGINKGQHKLFVFSFCSF